MKRFFGALAGAALLLSPVVMQAQVDPTVTVQLKSNPFGTGGTGYSGSGGGYLADFTVNFPSPVGDRSFTDYLIWCIDPGRGIGYEPVNFSLYTLADFAAQNFGSTNGHNPDLGDMTRLASLQATLAANWNALSIGARNDYQGSIWSEFDGYTTYGNVGASIIAGDPNFDITQYYVLWNNDNQTFLTKISEPSSALLAFAGMGAFLVAVRRRRIG